VKFVIAGNFQTTVASKSSVFGKSLVATLLPRSKIFPEGDALVEQDAWRLVGKSVPARLMSIEVFLAESGSSLFPASAMTCWKRVSVSFSMPLYFFRSVVGHTREPHFRRRIG
jgi:hypothetical protein